MRVTHLKEIFDTHNKNRRPSITSSPLVFLKLPKHQSIKRGYPKNPELSLFFQTKI